MRDVLVWETYHKAWGSCTESPRYNKKAWQALEQEVNTAASPASFGMRTPDVLRRIRELAQEQGGRYEPVLAGCTREQALEYLRGTPMPSEEGDQVGWLVQAVDELSRSR